MPFFFLFQFYLSKRSLVWHFGESSVLYVHSQLGSVAGDHDPGLRSRLGRSSDGWQCRSCSQLSPLGFLISVGEECDIDINECDSNPCHHAGTCLDQPNGYTCHCPHGWVGANCEIREYFCCYLTSHFHSTRRGYGACPGGPCQRQPRANLSYPCLPSPRGVPLLTAPCPSPSFPSLNPAFLLGWEMRRCHPEFTAPKTAKNVPNRGALESCHKIESLC